MNKQQDIDEKYMRRCLQIAANGLQNAKPNPSVELLLLLPTEELLVKATPRLTEEHMAK